MSLIKKPLNYLESLIPPLQEWQTLDKSTLLKHLEDIEDTTSPLMLNNIQTLNLLEKEKSVTVESVLEHKKMILKDRSVTCKKKNQDTKSSQTLDQVSTSKGKVLDKSWTLHIQEKSKNWWLPTRTDYRVSDLTLLNISSPHTRTLQSWFSTTFHHPLQKSLLKTSYKFLPSLVPELTDYESTKVRSKTIQIFPTAYQRRILKKIVGAYRFCYNRAISYIKQLNKEPKYAMRKIEKKWKKTRVNKTSMQTLRKELKKVRKLPKWDKEIPSHIPDLAFKEASNSYKACIKKYKKEGTISKLQYKSKRKSVIETISMEKNFLSKRFNGFFPKLFKENPRFKSSENINGKKDFKLSYHRRLKEWYVHMPYDVKFENYSDHKHNFIALDPGEVIFQTGYSEDHAVMLGKNGREKMMFVCKDIDRLKSKRDKCFNHQKRQSLRRALHRRIKYLKNLKNDLHWKSANYLAKNYKNILIPIFKSGEMVKTLNHSVSRNMMNLSHYSFRMRLIQKCEQYQSNIYVVTEEYTSKTCTSCGTIGSLNKIDYRTYKCENCDCEINRDINGSRNIFLKHIE